MEIHASEAGLDINLLPLDSAMYCGAGSTWKSFGGSSSLAACCPTAGNCNPPYQCGNGLQVDLYNGDASKW